MLHTAKTVAALKAKRDRFTAVEEARQQNLDALDQALETLTTQF